MGEFFEAFGVDIWKLGFQIANFLILLYLLNRFLFKPVLARLDERSAKISKGLEDAEAAARDREQAAIDLRHAYQDDLTGALRRDMGAVALQHEIDRARRGDGRLVLAFVDVDGLKSVNDRDGHGAGDELLKAVVTAMRSKLRSFDPIVRYGGDEFVCAMAAADAADAGRRFAEIRETLAHDYDHAAISVGVAELEAGDTLADLVARGDAALYKARRPC
jgi:diguanylate cyclase (GGDEF)-like protein